MDGVDGAGDSEDWLAFVRLRAVEGAIASFAWSLDPVADRELIRAFACTHEVDEQDPDNELLLEHMLRKPRPPSDQVASDELSEDVLPGLEIAPSSPREALLEALTEGARLLATVSATLSYFAIPSAPNAQLLVAARIGAASLVGRGAQGRLP
jgi:hypothetical protein